MNEDIIIVPIIAGVLGFTFSWVVWVLASNIRRSKTTRSVAELHAKLLDRCSASNDLLMYLESESGRRFLESATSETASPFPRILNAIQAGAILFLLGLSTVMVRLALDDPNARQAFLLLGSAALSIGAGFLISAAISYSLCRSWGLLKRAEAAR
jgi:hypothetical protein